MKTKLIRIGIVVSLLIGSVFIFSMPVAAATTCSLSLSMTNPTVNAGASFDIALNITVSGGSTRTANCSLNYDPVKLQCTGVDLGPFYKDWATANSASGASVQLLPSSPVPVDNVNGKVQPGCAIFGDYLGGGPTGTGVVFVYHMTAKSTASGTTAVHTSDVEMSDGSNPPATISGVTVQNDNMQITINNPNAQPAPTITSFTPTSAGAGVTVVITGTNFTGAGTVTFGNTAAQSFTVNSATQITAVVGSGATGAISISTASGTGTSSSSFTFLLPPAISNITPTSGGVGTTITINGSYFTGVTAVKFGAIAAQSFTVNRTGTQITAIVGTGQSGYVMVTTPGGTSQQTTTFTFIQPAAITSFNPTSGSSGTSVVINGANFTGATAVSFGGVAAQSFTVNSAVQITAVVGTGASVAISVTTVGTPATKDGFTFTTATTSTTTATTSTTTSTTTTTPATSTNTPTTSNTTTTTTTTPTTQPYSPITRTSRTTTTVARIPPAASVSSSGLVTALDLSNSMDTGGTLQSDFLQGNIRYSGNNQIISLNIKNGTRIVAIDGSPVADISIQPATNVPAAPAGQNIVSALEFGPTGATFSFPMNVIYGYDQTQVPQNIKASGLTLLYFDSQTNKWVKADYTVDILNHQITANISHFSLYAVMSSGSPGFMGVGWSLAGTIIILELLIGGLVMYYFVRRRRPPALAPAAVQGQIQVQQPVMEVKASGLPASPIINAKETSVTWDDILPRSVKKGEPFKTHLEIIGGKIIIPTSNDSVGIELVNNPDSRILVSLEYDPELHPHGMAKIMVLGSIGSAEYEKSKGD